MSASTTTTSNRPPDSGKVGVYPGSFNPPTLAHLAIAEQAWRSHGLDRVDLVVSSVALAKESVNRPLFEHRIAVLEAVAASRPWLAIRVTDQQLLVDIADGYDLLIMGADKWQQIQELRWYNNDPGARDAALAALPPLAVADRNHLSVPEELTLDVDRDATDRVSSTRARAGELQLLPDQAQRFAIETGAWIDPDRYEQWLARSRTAR